MLDSEEVEDGKITVVGPEIDEVEPGSTIPFGVLIEVSGRKMQKDFEPILERQLHHFLNEAEGYLHVGQRDIIWERIAKKAVAAGFTLRAHRQDRPCPLPRRLRRYPGQGAGHHLHAGTRGLGPRGPRPVTLYHERDERIGSLTDEAVDTFYSCTLCQSFAPDHVCVITPERPGSVRRLQLARRQGGVRDQSHGAEPAHRQGLRRWTTPRASGRASTSSLYNSSHNTSNGSTPTP